MLSIAWVHVICLGKKHRHPEAMVKWKEQLQYFQSSMNTKNLFGIDREPPELESNIFPGHTTVEILREIQMIMSTCRTRLEEFEDRIIFMSMFNDIDWTKTGNFKECFSNSERVRDYAKKFRWDIGLFSVLAKKKMVRNTKLQNLKDSGILLQMSWSPISKTADIQSSELPVRLIDVFFKVGHVRFTSVVTLGTQRFYFARSTLQTSSVSTEQSRIGVMN